MSNYTFTQEDSDKILALLSTPYDGDVLETALTSGIKFSAEKHNVTTAHVYNLVANFSKETAHPCQCEIDFKKTGMKWFCTFCTAGQNNRLRI